METYGMLDTVTLPANSATSQTQRRVVDLTHPMHEGMTTYPSPCHPVFEMTQLGRHGLEDRETRRVTFGTHTGTHCDAPRHFIADGESVDNLSLDVLIGPAQVVDLTFIGPLERVEVAHFQSAMGDSRPKRVLLRFDWSDRWGQMSFYKEHPYLSAEAAEWLVNRGVKLLGMDSPTPDDPRSGPNNPPDSPNHQILLGAGVILVEYLCNLRALTQSNIELIVLPLKLRGADGSPVRCVAIEQGGKADD
jgi:kynurenine formamidase